MQIRFQPEVQDRRAASAEFEDNNIKNKALNAYGKGKTGAYGASGISVDINGDKVSHGFKGVEGGKKNGKKSILEDAASFDAKNAHNYMAVMSNTMSAEDFQKLSEEGFRPGGLSGAEAVTNLDRIKVVLREAGVNVAGFTDTIDREAAEAITGSASGAERVLREAPVDEKLTEDTDKLTGFIKDSLEEADLPATEDNIREAQEAFDMASRLRPLNDSDIENMLLKGQEPAVENVYLAEHSGAGASLSGAAGYFATDNPGYLAEIAGNEDLSAITDQIDGVIERSGLKISEETREDARYLIRQGFALNEENLSLYEDLKSISFPLKAGDLMDEITEAVAEGRGALNAYLIKGYGRIKNERILNETRLVMNSEALKSRPEGEFNPDMEELSERVRFLKEKERAFYRAAFSDEAKVSLAEETAFKVSAIKEMPVSAIGSFASAEDFTLNDVYEAGDLEKRRFDAANATYEAVGTEVRADLGDRIGEAFRNIGSLLKDIAFEETADNLRAGRILAYNNMEFSAENLTRVKEADQAVRTLVERLTGAVTVSLIKDGVNPLETGVNNLIDRISEMEGISEENAKYSEYLFRLERNNEISSEEAESYIGIYRLIRQLEKSDGAVTGALVNSGRDLTLKNLLTELRTRNRGHMDYTVDDDFGGIGASEGSGNNLKIDTQIETAFRKEPGEEDKNKETGGDKEKEAGYEKNVVHEIYDKITPEAISSVENFGGDTTLDEILKAIRENMAETKEADRAFYEEQAADIREAADKDEAVYEALLHYGEEITADNVNAMDFLMNSRGRLFPELESRLPGDTKEKIRKHSEAVIESLGEDRDVLEEAGDDTEESGIRKAYSEMTEELQDILKESMERADNYIDLKALQNLNRCLSLASSLSREENYEIPMEIEGALTSVNLKVVRGTGEAGASVSFETPSYGRVYARFGFAGEKISGYVLTSTDEGLQRLKQVSEGFLGALDREGIVSGSINFEKTSAPDINKIPETADRINVTPLDAIRSGKEGSGGSSRTEGKDAEDRGAVLYRTARAFLRAL